MKKANIALLSVCLCFLILLSGIYIGRQTGSSYVTLPLAGQSDADTASGETSVVSSQAETSGRVNINTATAYQLTLLPGIGDTLAERIIAYRTENGTFASVEDILNVSGIGEKKLEQIRDYITVGG